MTRYAPPAGDVAAVQSWLEQQGLTVERVARNHLMLEYSGTIAQWNAAFAAELHVVDRSSSSTRDAAYGLLTDLPVPAPLVGKIKRLLMPDMALPTGMPAKDTAPIVTTPPPNDDYFTPAEIAGAYGLGELYAKGYRGAGMTLGVVGGTTIRTSDAQSMWQAFGIARSSATLQDTMEPQRTRDSEPSLDVQLAGALAPDATLIYKAPIARIRRWSIP